MQVEMKLTIHVPEGTDIEYVKTQLILLIDDYAPECVRQADLEIVQNKQ